MRRLLPALLLAIGLLGHLLLQARPALKKIESGGAGRDYASYYYAVQVAAEGGDPYDTAALSKHAAAERTRKAVHPYFYPPPFLLAAWWSRPLSLAEGYRATFFINEAMLAGCLALGAWGLGVPLWAVALLLYTWTPIPDNAWMGQANLWALFPALAGLVLAERRRDRSAEVLAGVLVGAAAMMKMSPALFLAWWALRRRWVPVGAAIGTALGLSGAALAVVPLEAQLRFYTEILPGFSRGDYHGLSVPISLPANHSIPDLFDRAFPSAGRLLSDTARHASAATSLGLLTLWAWFARKATDAGAALMALAVLMVAVPVYTYEHHLVFLVVAMGVAAGRVAEESRHAPRGLAILLWLVLALTWFVLAWPLTWLRAVEKLLPAGLSWLTRESKTMGEGLLFLLLLRASVQPSRQK